MAYFINIGIRRSRGLAAITAGLHKLILAVTEVFIPGWLLLVLTTNKYSMISSQVTSSGGKKKKELLQQANNEHFQSS